MFTGLLITFSVYATETVSYTTYTTKTTLDGQPANAPTTEFNCSDRIFLVLEATGLSEGVHQLTVKWINPIDEQQELTKFPFKAFPSFSRIWAWLQLHGHTGAVIGQVFDPSFGMEEFIGRWRAEVFMENEKINDLEFTVIC